MVGIVGGGGVWFWIATVETTGALELDDDALGAAGSADSCGATLVMSTMETASQFTNGTIAVLITPSAAAEAIPDGAKAAATRSVDVSPIFNFLAGGPLLFSVEGGPALFASALPHGHLLLKTRPCYPRGVWVRMTVYGCV